MISSILFAFDEVPALGGGLILVAAALQAAFPGVFDNGFMRRRFRAKYTVATVLE